MALLANDPGWCHLSRLPPSPAFQASRKPLLLTPADRTPGPTTLRVHSPFTPPRFPPLRPGGDCKHLPLSVHVRGPGLGAAGSRGALWQHPPQGCCPAAQAPTVPSVLELYVQARAALTSARGRTCSRHQPLSPGDCGGHPHWEPRQEAAGRRREGVTQPPFLEAARLTRRPLEMAQKTAVLSRVKEDVWSAWTDATGAGLAGLPAPPPWVSGGESTTLGAATLAPSPRATEVSELPVRPGRSGGLSPQGSGL